MYLSNSLSWEKTHYASMPHSHIECDAKLLMRNRTVQRMQHLMNVGSFELLCCYMENIQIRLFSSERKQNYDKMKGKKECEI